VKWRTGREAPIRQRQTTRGAAAIGTGRRFDMIAAVSLRLLYLIFQQVVGLVLLMGRRSVWSCIQGR
jgi:hypothetical protein